MRFRFLCAIVLMATSGLVGAGSRAIVPGVPTEIPGRDLPVVRQHTYRMAGKIRVVMLWVGRDDVGSGIIKWRGAEDDKAIELLIGSDPERAPGQLNKWGYLVETMHGERRGAVALSNRRPSPDSSATGARGRTSYAGASKPAKREIARARDSSSFMGHPAP